MTAGDFDPNALLALVAAAIAIAATISVARARSLLAIGLMLALFAAALAAAFAALDAPDMALIEVLAGVGFLPLAWIGVVLLTAPSAQARAKALRWGVLGAAVAVAGGLAWTLPDLSSFGGGDAGQGRIFVSRAWGETGVRNGVAAVMGNYRALDALAQIGALMGAAFALYALLGFGERAGRPETIEDEGEI